MFERRANENELLDSQDCPQELSLESYRFMERVNLLFGGIASVRKFLEGELRRTKGGRGPLRVLDIGSGSCDIPLAIRSWAKRKGFAIHFTCLEILPSALSIARERIAKAGAEDNVELLAEDAFSHAPAKPYDCAVSSMCFHHFDDTQILELLRHLRGFVENAALINDLERSPFAWLGAWQLSAFSSAGVRHDSKLSVRRGFKPEELRALLSKLEGASVEVRRAWLCRVRAELRFEKGGS